MKAPTIPEGIEFFQTPRRPGVVRLTCCRLNCHESTELAANDQARIDAFVDKHRHKETTNG